MTPVALAVGLLPVLLFLTALLFLDSYKLVTRKAVLLTIAGGGVAAAIAFGANIALLGVGIEPTILKYYLAPLIEECLKGAIVVGLIRAARVGFMVDAGIHGFAAGAGFALVENVYYAQTMGGSGLAVWIVRGLGTAVMHGSATAIVGILTKDLSDRNVGGVLRVAWPGLAIAAVIHSLYNHFLLDPMISTALLVLLMPLLVIAVFERSERATQAWLGAGLDTDVELLEMIGSGEIHTTHVGQYLESLKSRFPGPVVGDMLCYLQVYLELSLRAKGILIARAAGVDVPVDPSVRANFEELKFLERSVGPTGKIALLPFLRTSRRDLWQLTMLAK